MLTYASPPDNNATAQRWLTAIQRLQKLITTALTQSQAPQALRLWQALQMILTTVIDKQEFTLPPLVMGELLQEAFLLALAPYLDDSTLQLLRRGCEYAAKELREQAAGLYLTKVKLTEVQRASPVLTIHADALAAFYQLDKLQENLGDFVRSYTAAVRANQAQWQEEALARIKTTKMQFLKVLTQFAWDFYLHSQEQARQEAIRDKVPFLPTPAETHCLALEWLATLTEQQQRLADHPHHLLFNYRDQLAQLRQVYQAAVAVIPLHAAYPEISATLATAQHTFSKKIRELFAQIIRDGETVLGPAPCIYAFLGFGSLSRDEMLPYSDLECGLIIPPNLEPAQARLSHTYLLTLWRWFTFSLQSLAESGEHGERLGIHLDHQLCPKATVRGLEGCYGTPAHIFFDSLPTATELGFAQTYSLMKPVYITGRAGNEETTILTLMQTYHQALLARIQHIQSTPGTAQLAVAWAQLPEHQQEWQALISHLRAQQTAITLKTDYATPLLCLVYDLALYHNVDIANTLVSVTATGEPLEEHITNTSDAIRYLIAQQHLSPAFGQALQQAYTQVMWLRLHAQHHYQQQLELAVMPDVASHAVDVFYMENSRLSEQLARVFTKPTSASLYRLTPQAYTYLQRIMAFIFEPVVSLLQAQAQNLRAKQPWSWHDPLQAQVKMLLADRLQHSSPEAALTWVRLLATQLLESNANEAVHDHCYDTLIHLNAPERLYAAYLDSLPPNEMLVVRLSSLPRRDGYRQAERLSYNTLASALRAIGLAVPETNASTTTTGLEVLLHSPAAGRRRLHSSVVAQLIDLTTGDIKPFNPQAKSLHKVGQVHYGGYTLHVKQHPNHPGMDYAIDLLHRRLIGHGTTANELAVLTVTSPHYRRRYPVLFSTTVPGPTFAAALQQPQNQWPHWDSKAMTELCLMAILTLPGDAAGRNFIVQPTTAGSHTLVCIDSDVAFVEPVVKLSGLRGHKLQVATVLFGLPEVMQQPFVQDTLEAICQWDAELLLIHWLEALAAREAQYEALFNTPELQQLYQDDANNPFTPLLLFRQGTLALLALNLRYTQGLCRAALQTQQPLTPWQLLQKLQSRVAKHYQAPLTTEDLTPEQRLEAAIQTLRGSLSSCQSLTASLGKVPTLEEVMAKIIYSPNAAKQELEVLKLEQFGDTVFIHQHDTANQHWRIRADFTTLNQIQPDAAARQRLILQSLIGRSYQELILVGCTALDDDLLKGLLSDSPGLQVLRLRQCLQITPASIDYLAAHCPQLTTLELTGTTLEKFASAYLGNPVVFPQLTTLYIIDAKQLCFIQLQALKLTTFSLQRTPTVGKAQGFIKASPKSLLAAPNLKTAYFSHCAAITETWLATALQDCKQLHQLTLNGCPQVLYRELKEAAPQLVRVIVAKMPELVPNLKAIADNHEAKLNLSGLSITENQFFAITLALQHNTAIKEINLEQALGNGCIPLLASLLHDRSHLQALKLARNHLTNKGLAALVTALPAQAAIRALDLSYNQISAEGVAKLAAFLEKNPPLTHLDLTGNDIRNESALRLVRALKSNRQLTTLVLSSSLIDRDILALLEAILMRNRQPQPPGSPEPTASFWQPGIARRRVEADRSNPPPLPLRPGIMEEFS